MASTAPNRDRLVVVGASVRGLAASAARAGREVHAVDLFGDLDLRAAAASVTPTHGYPHGLVAAVATLPPGPWAYTGAVENHPDVIRAIAAHRRLAGCPADAVAAVRDPAVLAAAVRRAGLGFPETRCQPDGLPEDGSWLIKPRRSAGGHGIALWLGAATSAAVPLHEGIDLVWQQRIDGRCMAACYLMTEGRGLLLGASRQVVGRRWCHARPFGYCGSIDVDPHGLASGCLDQLVRLGGQLADRFGLVGLVGVDLIVDRRERVHVLEVNPRPTASMELVERATGVSLAESHLAACGVPATPSGAGWPRRGTWSKAILFAAQEVAFDDASLAAIRQAAGGPIEGWPPLADIPCPPQRIPAGRPVCTLFAHGRTPRESLEQLRRRTAAVAGRLRGPP